jgi:hypothetical protein
MGGLVGASIRLTRPWIALPALIVDDNPALGVRR